MEFREADTAKVIETGEIIQIKNWIRPYGIPYAVAVDGREFHASQLVAIYGVRAKTPAARVVPVVNR